MDVKSPCIKICKLKNDVCIGCLRTIDEIKNWKKLSKTERTQVLDNIKQRGYDAIEDDTE